MDIVALCAVAKGYGLHVAITRGRCVFLCASRSAPLYVLTGILFAFNLLFLLCAPARSFNGLSPLPTNGISSCSFHRSFSEHIASYAILHFPR